MEVVRRARAFGKMGGVSGAMVVTGEQGDDESQLCAEDGRGVGFESP